MNSGVWLLAACLILGQPQNDGIGQRLSGEVPAADMQKERAVPELFRLESAPFSFEMEKIRAQAAFDVWKVRFPSPLASPDPENNVVHCEYFLPRGEQKRPAVIVLHILGADFALSRYVAARLAQEEVAALFLKLPYYGERRPQGPEAKRFLSADMERSVMAMRQGACDIRRATSWLASRPELDPERLGICGISLGGIMAGLAAGVEPRLTSVAVMLAGGDLAHILWDLPEPDARRYRELWIKSGRTREDLEKLTLPLDPLTYARNLRSKKMLMIAGKVDEVIPPESVQALWEAAGKPRILWYDCGHYSAVGYLLPAVRETTEFFLERAK